MRRRLITILICLFVGVVVNIAVAWRLAMRPAPSVDVFFNPSADTQMYRCPWRGTSDYDYFLTLRRGEIEITEKEAMLGMYLLKHIQSDEFETLLPSWSKLQDEQPIELFDDAWRYKEFATGFPFYSLLYKTWDVHKYPDSGPPVSRWMIQVPDSWMEYLNKRKATNQRIRGALPCRPIWPGFYVNTLIFAFAAWIVFFLPFRLRRFTRKSIRRRKGLCTRCGYDLRGTTQTCPECGAKVAMSRPNGTLQ